MLFLVELVGEIHCSVKYVTYVTRVDYLCSVKYVTYVLLTCLKWSMLVCVAGCVCL